MQFHNILLLLLLVPCCLAVHPLELFKDPNAKPQINLNRKTTADRISVHGYPVEKHNVLTEDGYIITLFRIPYSHNLGNQNVKRPIALLQHGLFGCSDNWISNGPNDAISYMLADAGYDVWIGNARGNTYSRNHSTRSVYHPQFWRFSWHEIGVYDLAAMIDAALSTENGQGQSAIHYVGHSQGTTAFFAFLSQRPEYNVKIKTAHMLAPVAFMNNMSDQLVRTLAPYLGHDNTYSKFFSSQEFLPMNDLFMVLGYKACTTNGIAMGFCKQIAYMLEGGIERSNTTAMLVNADVGMGGASTDQILHYMQEQQSGHYRQFDFGTSKNKKVYGTAEPPDYPVHLITARLHLWYSDNDSMAAVEDVLRLAEMLPNKVMHHMEDPLWSHGEFSSHWEVRKYINEPIIDIMNKYEDGIIV